MEGAPRGGEMVKAVGATEGSEAQGGGQRRSGPCQAGTIGNAKTTIDS